MKHRSIVVLILIVMMLAVVPRAAHSFASLRDASGISSKAGLWNVLLRYHA